MSEEDILGKMVRKEVKESDYVFRAGFENWQLLSQTPQLMDKLKLAKVPPVPPHQDQGKDKRAALRGDINEGVVAHNGAKIASGVLRDISTGGVFLETKQKIFQIGEVIKLIVKEGKNIGKPIYFSCEVVRVDGSKGYGLKFKDVSEDTFKCIENYMKKI
jgi:hypothetical protein